jgi:hypothetical protein
LVLVRISNYQIYARECCDFFRCSLGVAASNYDSCVGILAADSADGGASVMIGACGDRARVQDYD